MDLGAILALYDQEQRIDIESPGTRREVGERVVRQIDLSGHRSSLIHSRLTGEGIDDTIQAEIDRFTTLGHDFEWKVHSHDTPEDLKERLMARGFELEETEAIMVLDLSERSGLPAPDPHDVRRITDPDSVGDVTSVNARVWNDDRSWLSERLVRDLRNAPDQLSIYVRYVDGKPVSSAWMYFTPHSRFASLWGGSTLPEHRRHGFYSALLAARIIEARQRGIQFLTIDALPMSRPIAAKFGFRILTHATGCIWNVKTRSSGSVI